MKWSLVFLACLTSASFLSAQEPNPDKYRPNIDKGLAWLVKQQKADGSFSKDNGGYSTATTAFAGMALLADGNTLTDGKHSANLRGALGWFLALRPMNPKYEGVLTDLANSGSAARYMCEHGIALSFLARVYGEIATKKDRDPVRERLIKAVDFAVKAQSEHGGWYYTSSSIEGHNSIENVATMLVLQGLLDARNMGIAVPKETLKRAHAYLAGCTTEKGGVVYSGGMTGKGPPVGGERPTVTAMALAAYLPMRGASDELTRRWLRFAAESRFLKPEELNHHFDLVPHYYFSKVVLHLGDNDGRATFPDKKIPAHLAWVKYRAALFDTLQREQAKDGSWSPKKAWSAGALLNSCLALNILLCENTLAFRLSR